MKIIWLDDDVNRSTLKAYYDELTDAGKKVIRFNNPDSFLSEFAKIEHNVLIVDIMMPTGNILTKEESKAGYETGIAVVKRYKKQFPNNRVIIFSILPPDSIKIIANSLNTEFLAKRKTKPHELLAKIK